MPEKLEKELKAQARRKGFTGERFRRYVFGTLQRIEERKKKRKK